MKKQLIGVIAAVALAAPLAGPASAASLGVRVVSDSGEPLQGVAVCFGTHGNYKRFGTAFTTADGQAIVDVPNMPVIVTISKNRFMTARLVEPARGFNLVKDVKLTEGAPGRTCKAGSSLAERKAITVDRVDVADGIFSVSLTPVITGEPTHYRVSKSDSFANAGWRRYTPVIELTGGLADGGDVFLQFRRQLSTKGAVIETESDVVTVSVPG